MSPDPRDPRDLGDAGDLRDPGEMLLARAVEFDRLGAPLYAALARGMAADWAAGGVVRRLWSGREDAPYDAVVDLRLLGGLYRLVLQRRAPALAPYYRSLGGGAQPAGVWPVARDVLAEHVEELRAGLEVVPQTNEVGRAAALLVGMLDAAHRTGLSDVRLLEVGASAGLNLLVDHYRIGGRGWAVGPEDSPVDLTGAVSGPVRPTALRILERRGCDLHPVDPRSAEGRLRLTSFVWPDHVERHARLSAALAVAAAADPVAVDPAPAGDWVRDELARPPAAGVLTVLWHSVVLLYLPQRDRDAVDQAVASASRRGPVARVRLEHRSLRQSSRPELSVELDGELRVLADADPHGVPVVLRPGASVG